MGRAARRAGAFVASGLLLAACTAGRPSAKGPVSPPTPSASSARGCSRLALLASGESVASARLGAIDFVSTHVGVALSAVAIPCDIPGYGITERPQSVRLAVTIDGGKHWVVTGKSIPSSLSTAEDVVAASTSAVWALDDEGTLLETKDSGTTWATQALPTRVEQVARVGDWLWALSCPSSGESACTTPVLERAPLSGGTWERVVVPWMLTDFVPSIVLHVVANEVVILESSDGGSATSGLLVSTDGAKSWTFERPPSGPGGLCVSYPQFSADSPSDWWLLCVGGAAAGSSTKALMRSTDGGQN